MSDLAGTIRTVEGPIEPEALGVTTTHEHLFADFVDAWFDRPRSAVDRRLAREPVSLDNLRWVRRNGESNRDNLRLDSFEEAVEEVARFRRSGGDALVDVTPKNVGEDPRRVRRVARETGLRIVHGTAYYTLPGHPPAVERATVEELAAEFERDVRDGIGDTDVPAGLVGEIGLSGHIHDQEEKVLRAGARAALRTGAPLMVHPPGRSRFAQRDRTYPSSRWGLDVLDLLEEESVPAERVAICHMDRTLFEDVSWQLELAERGPYLEFDLWGTDVPVDRYDDGYPSDRWRWEAVSELLDAGHGSRLLFAHDVHQKIQRTAYGGNGYGHLLENALPRLRAWGMTTEQVETVTVDNPRRLLTFDDPT